MNVIYFEHNFVGLHGHYYYQISPLRLIEVLTPLVRAYVNPFARPPQKSTLPPKVWKAAVGIFFQPPNEKLLQYRRKP